MVRGRKVHIFAPQHLEKICDFTPGKLWYSFYKRLSWPQGLSAHGVKKSVPPAALWDPVAQLLAA